ncbi:hypothetical protein [Janthinobacterium sp. CAN_S7]|uniref:hypothetical protein n=1 Tax=Janthinobacterium sp. CAN_S7 TaxID=3071704 RepID=UPI00319DCC0C
MASSAAKEIQTERFEADMQNHSERVEWLTSANPKWSCGTPIGEFDRRTLLCQSQEFIAANAV